MEEDDDEEWDNKLNKFSKKKVKDVARARRLVFVIQSKFNFPSERAQSARHNAVKLSCRSLRLPTLKWNSRAVVVDQLAERSPLILEVRGSNPVINKIFFRT